MGFAYWSPSPMKYSMKNKIWRKWGILKQYSIKKAITLGIYNIRWVFKMPEQDLEGTFLKLKN